MHRLGIAILAMTGSWGWACRESQTVSESERIACLLEDAIGTGEPDRYLIVEPGAVDQVRQWVKARFRKAPPREMIGSVLPRQVLLLSRPGDIEFKTGPAVTYVLWNDLDARGRSQLHSEADLERLLQIFKQKGQSYRGPVRSDQYGDPKKFDH